MGLKQAGDSVDSAASFRTVIGISDINDVLRQVNLKPFEGTWTVVIVDSAESMSEEAANALLKTLEEPPPQVLLPLLTSNEEAILATIKSRCQRRVGNRDVAKLTGGLGRCDRTLSCTTWMTKFDSISI